MTQGSREDPPALSIYSLLLVLAGGSVVSSFPPVISAFLPASRSGHICLSYLYLSFGGPTGREEEMTEGNGKKTRDILRHQTLPHALLIIIILLSNGYRPWVSRLCNY